MSRFCCVFKNCGSCYTPGSFLSFFEFPKNENRSNVWRKQSGDIYIQLNINNKNNIYLCEKHFFEKDIIKRVGRTCLKRGRYSY